MTPLSWQRKPVRHISHKKGKSDFKSKARPCFFILVYQIYIMIYLIKIIYFKFVKDINLMTNCKHFIAAINVEIDFNFGLSIRIFSIYLQQNIHFVFLRQNSGKSCLFVLNSFDTVFLIGYNLRIV